MMVILWVAWISLLLIELSWHNIGFTGPKEEDVWYYKCSGRDRIDRENFKKSYTLEGIWWFWAEDNGWSCWNKGWSWKFIYWSSDSMNLQGIDENFWEAWRRMCFVKLSRSDGRRYYQPFMLPGTQIWEFLWNLCGILSQIRWHFLGGYFNNDEDIGSPRYKMTVRSTNGPIVCVSLEVTFTTDVQFHNAH